MSLGAITLSVEYSYVMSQASFKRALLVAIVNDQPFGHLSEFHRWLAFRIESFGETEFLYDPVPYHEYPGGQRAASEALLTQWASWFPAAPQSSHTTVALTFSFTADDLRRLLAHAIVFREDSPDLSSLDHRQTLEMCVRMCIERGRDSLEFSSMPDAESYIIRECVDTIQRLFHFLS